MKLQFNQELITIRTKNRSIAELSLMDSDLVLDLFVMPEKMPLYMFNRISVIPAMQGKGDGKILLDEVCRIADLYQFAIFLGINSYGRMNTEDLRSWYIRHNWIDLGNKLMVRFPK